MMCEVEAVTEAVGRTLAATDADGDELAVKLAVIEGDGVMESAWLAATDAVKFARSALKSDARLLDALCLLLLPDFSCTGYLPPRGQAVVRRFTKDVERMRQKRHQRDFMEAEAA